MDDLLRQMGKRIYDRRKQLRMTQEELAEKAGITPQTVSTAELGKKALRPENIIRICSALDISSDYLLMGKVTNDDYAALSGKISELSSAQYRYLEDIVNSYMSAVLTEKKADDDNSEDKERNGWHKFF
ncbi:MAG: helix-turn-helix domain-containing protein [Lachnospiraceae bacterium]|nr:helix-turn-helix domain-containing protein [Lachnospiraceae bacterium]